jgi:hypothetical protein
MADNDTGTTGGTTDGTGENETGENGAGTTATGGTATEDGKGTGTGGDSEGDAAQLGDPGKRALDAMKRERNAAKKELADLKAQIKQYEDKDKTETQRLQEAAEDAKNRAGTAENDLRRLRTALDRAPENATLTQIRAVAKRLHGDTDDELEADADELFALLAPDKPTDDTTDRTPRVPGKPRETLRGGGEPDTDREETDPRKLADLIGRH